MLKKMRGFTLIELLIVVAIIGILAALLIPNAMTAIQKAKQKSTMKSIMTISTALTDYVTDRYELPEFSAQLTAGDAFLDNIAPFYVRVAPWADDWGYGFYIHTQVDGVTGSAFDVTLDPDNYGVDSFLVGSTGRDGDHGGGTDPSYSDAPGSNPDDGLYEIQSMRDFNADLVALEGNWVIAPATRALD